MAKGGIEKIVKYDNEALNFMQLSSKNSFTETLNKLNIPLNFSLIIDHSCFFDVFIFKSIYFSVNL